MVDKKLLSNALLEALDRLYKEDGDLIKYKTFETCIMHRFALYLEPFVKSLGQQYSCDIEYNRNYDGPKRIFNTGNGSRPDLIIHERKTNNNNLLVLECKTYWSQEASDVDEEKVTLFCDENGTYGFKYGILLYLGKTRKEAKMWYVSE